MLQGRWYITAGLNRLFDTFDCQTHDFEVPRPGLLSGDINWRVPRARGDFIERNAKQTFAQVLCLPWIVIDGLFSSFFLATAPNNHYPPKISKLWLCGIPPKKY